MKDFFRHNGGLLLVIALLLTILVGAGSAALGRTNPVANAVNTITAPVRGGISAVLDWAEGVYQYVFRYSDMQAELDELRAQVAELEGQVRDAQEALRENEQLRNALGLQQKRKDFVLESAKVTAHSASNWESTLTLSKGTSAGVTEGDCVITETGVLVGVITEVGLNWSTVSTLINPGVEMGGIVTRTYSAGILEGDFTLMGEGKLKLSYLPDSAHLVSGDEVLTSGKGEVYPSGLVVGQVEGVFTDPSGQSRYAVVLPKADLDTLIQVFIIKEFDLVE